MRKFSKKRKCTDCELDTNCYFKQRSVRGKRYCVVCYKLRKQMVELNVI